MAHVAGYVVVNDVSARDWQGSPPALREGEKGDGQWLRAKGSDTFLPIGPDFVTADELDPGDGPALRSWRIPGSGDGRASRVLMQDGKTADLIYDVPGSSASSRSRSRSTRATSSSPARRRASACSATRRCSWSRATASAARSRASARWRTRSSTGPRTRAALSDAPHAGAATRGGTDARAREDRRRPRASASRRSRTPSSASTTS